MKKTTFLSLTLGVFLLSGCAHEFNLVYKSSDSNYRYEYAKECFVKGKYTNAITLLTELITVEKGTENAQESLYMLGMANYFNRDYETAAQTFKRYYQSYPRGVYAEMARYYEGQSLYLSTPEPRLDQSQTVSAIAAYQEYLDAYPDAKLKKEAQQHLFELQEKLVTKELYTARLYYDLGPYFGKCTQGGNNYESCIVTAQNSLKHYPYTERR